MVFVAQGGVAQGQFVFSPVGEDGAVDDQCGDEVDQHAARDDAQALPAGLGAVFPGLRLFLQIVGPFGLVHHACNVAVAAQGYPAQAPKGVVLVFGTQVGFFPRFGGLGVKE